MRHWALRGLARELRRDPRRTLPILGRFVRIYRAAKIVGLESKIMQFGTDGDAVFKLAVYAPHWPGPAIENRMRRALTAGYPSSEQVTLSITDRCPYKCRHCSNSRRKGEPLELPRLLELVADIQRIGGSWLNIGGGEPMLVFSRALAVVEAAGDRSETWLNTTGYQLDDDKAARLKAAGLFGGRVSLHSHQPKEHDAFVGYDGAFQIAVDALKAFRKAGLCTVLSACVPQQSIAMGMIDSLIELARSVGAGFLEIIPIRPAGRALIQCSHAELQQHDVSRKLFREFNRGARYSDYPAVNSPAYLETPELFGCVAGADRLYISASGDVQPCPLVNLAIGNVRTEPLETICARMRALVQGPRSDLLCSVLGPILHERLGADDPAQAFPVPPEESRAILQSLPPAQTPQAWRLPWFG